MVKAYLRYVQENAFSMIAGSASNVVYHPDGKHIITAANEFVLIINIKTGIRFFSLNSPGEVVKKLYEDDKHHEVTCISITSQKDVLYLMSGYSDGDIIIWDMKEYTVKTHLNGHKSAVTTARFGENDTTLVSGGADNCIIVWDIIGELSLYKLNGHKNAITKLEILRYVEHGENADISFNFILSSSKDGLFKIWDMSIQDCVATVPGITNEIWSFAIDRESGTILLGSNSEELQIIRLKVRYDSVLQTQQYYEDVGVYQRKAASRAIELYFDNRSEYLFIINSDKAIEVYKILTDKDAEKKAKRKRKRLREKEKEEEANQIDISEYKSNFLNRINHLTIQHFPKKVKSIAFPRLQKAGQTRLCLTLHNNTLEIHDFVETPESHLEAVTKFDRMGHRSAVRSLAISSDDSMLLTGSSENVKLWSTFDFQCIRTIETGWVTASAFLSGDKFFLVGEKTGQLTLFDVSNGEVIDTIKAHNESIWSIHINEKTSLSEGLTIMTGGADKNIKFWEIVLNKVKGSLKLREIKEITMVDEIHCVKFTSDGKYFAVALMDTTMKIFYTDTAKLFLNLYGHKLPVLSFDISSDGALLVSGSADKNIKLWGTDFGNCKRSIFAHQDSIMAVAFVKDTHYFFSVGKDKVIKYWDGDTYDLVMDFEYHLGEIWAIAVSSIGDYFVTASNDKSVRFWKQTKEQVFVSEEEAKRNEKVMVDNYASEKIKHMEDNEDTTLVAATTVSKLSLDNLKHGENVIEAIERAEKLREDQEQFELAYKDYMSLPKHIRDTQQPPEQPKVDTLFGKTIPEFVLDELQKIKYSELESCLKFLHFNHMEKLLYYLKYYIFNNINVELSTRILYFILQTHETHIKNSEKLSKLLASIQKRLREQLEREQDLLGVNIAGLKMMVRSYKQNKESLAEEEDIFKKRVSFL